MKENENTETSEGFFYYYLFMGRAGLNLGIYFLG